VSAFNIVDVLLGVVGSVEGFVGVTGFIGVTGVTGFTGVEFIVNKPIPWEL
jgi:hypothetical protein